MPAAHLVDERRGELGAGPAKGVAEGNRAAGSERKPLEAARRLLLEQLAPV